MFSLIIFSLGSRKYKKSTSKQNLIQFALKFHVVEMSWNKVRDKMTDGVSLNIPQVDFFEKSPAHTPTKVLKSLDLLSADGVFVPNNCATPCTNVSTTSSIANSPVMVPRFKEQSNQTSRRKSMISDIYYDHTISDEFSQISFTINERRSSAGSEDSLPIYTFSPAPQRKNIVYRKRNSENNQIIIAKVVAGDGEEDEIEIIDLDDDEEYHSSFNTSQPKENLYPNCDASVW